MADHTSVLVVSAAPDDRLSTTTLRLAVEELDRRPDVDVAVWYLRPGPMAPWWPDAKIIDHLRTWTPARILDLVFLRPIADRLRGLRLRRWTRRVGPDAIVLDDGLGVRVTGAAPRAKLVVRINPVPPPTAAMESASQVHPSLVIGANLPADGHDAPVLDMPNFVDFPSAPVLRSAEEARVRVRSSGGIPQGVPLVVGWGSDGWVDGSDLFVRLLWHLEHRHGVLAHGLWLRSGDEKEHADRLDAEARRCGVGDRFHLATDLDDGTRWAGDAVFLPYRAPSSEQDLLKTIVAGQAVVTFAPAGREDPNITAVAPLDLDDAAAAVDRALKGDIDERVHAVADRLGAAAWVDRFLVAIADPIP